jgi:hypothetical protein
MDNFASWIGTGVKGGGMFGVAGFETMEGVVSNIGYRQHSHPINVSGARMGFGLGASVGMVAILIFNCRNLMNMNGTQDADWGINLSLGGKWDSVVKGLKQFKFFATMAKIAASPGGKIFKKATPGEIDDLRNAMAYLYTAYDMKSMDGKPKLVAIDIPFAGVGAEVSWFRLEGEMTVGDLIIATEQTEPSPSGIRRGTI